MPEKTPTACPQCGARLAPGAERCDLCGAAVNEPPAEAVPRADAVPDPDQPDVRPVAEPQADAERGPFCNQCGWLNPADARFCSQCGARLQSVEGASAGPPPQPRPLAAPAFPPTPEADEEASGREAVPSGMGRQLGVLVGAAVLLVVGLYFVTYVSKRGVAAEPPASVAQAERVADDHDLEAQPLPPQMAEQVATLEGEIAGLEGEARAAKQAELVGLYIGAGRSDRAAVVQQALAEANGSPEAWARAGDLYTEWMESVEESHKPEVAPLAIAAYQAVLEAEPENADVRARMAWAYQYDRQNPMEAITQTNLVLEQDPDHLQANYNRGLFLMRINRLDQAREQLEKVQRIAGAGSPMFNQAAAMIEALREVQEEGGTPAPPEAAPSLEADVQPRPGTQPEVDVEHGAGGLPDAEGQSDPDVQPETDVEPGAEAQPEPDVEQDAPPEPDSAEADVRPGAEAAPDTSATDL